MAHDLDRFINAQEAVYQAQEAVYERVCEELRGGRKRSHWMWFVFPQVEGLGSSEMSQRYAIHSLDEARAYLAHPVLGARLRECAGLLLLTGAGTAEAIVGHVDAGKLRSSMTLFHRAAPEDPLFGQVLERFYGGLPDAATDAFLASSGRPPDPAE